MILTAYQYKLFFCAKKVVQYAQKINVIKKVIFSKILLFIWKMTIMIQIC